MGSQDSDVLESAGSKQADIEIGGAHGDEAGPGENHVSFVKQAEKTPCGVTRHAESGAGETVELAADDVAQGVARKSVGGEEADVDEHDDRTEADAEFAVEYECLYGVVPEKTDKEDGEIEKVTMDVLQDEGKTSFAAIIFAESGLSYGAGGRVEKKGAVVGFAVVIAGGAKAERCAEDENRRGKLPPTEGKQGRIKRRKVRPPFEESAFKGAGGGVEAETAEKNNYGKKLEPPGVTTLGLAKMGGSVRNRRRGHWVPRAPGTRLFRNQ